MPRAAPRFVALAACALALGSLLAWAQPLGFTTSVSPELVGGFAARFGAASRERLAQWQEFARRQKHSAAVPRAELFGAVNIFFNRVPFVSDLSHWGVEDYWATPAEMFASNGGDCEDYSIAKYFMLKELGVPIARLRITYVKSTRLNQAHMVLAYYPTPDADPLILDNLEDAVRPASQRSDLVPVYSFNDDEVWLAQGGRAGSSAQIRLWRMLLEKLEREARV